MRASELAAAIVAAIEAITPLTVEHEGDVFHGISGSEPPVHVDRAFSVGFGLPIRNPEFLDPQEYVIQGAVSVAYRDGPAVAPRILDDAELVAEGLADISADDLLSIEVQEGTVQPGPVDGVLFASTPFRARYRRG